MSAIQEYYLTPEPEVSFSGSLKERLYQNLDKAAEYEIKGDYDNYRKYVDLALYVDPENHDALFARAVHRLRIGEEGGWEDYDHRPTRIQLLDKCDEYPEWDGEDLTGKTIFVCGEQGLGDQIQFSRYIPWLKAAGPKRIVLWANPALARLFSILPCDVISDSRDLDTAPDYWIGLCSLARWFGVVPPFSGSILLNGMLLPHTDRLKVGLAWAGGPQHARDSIRSIHFDKMAEVLLDTPNCDFYSLQQGAAASQHGGRIADPMPWCMDMADTASIIEQLDVVVSVDTAIIHLAGALGVKAFMWHDDYYHEWRWGARNTDGTSKWYPTVRPTHERFNVIKRALGWSGGDDCGANIPVTLSALAIIKSDTRVGEMVHWAADKYIGRSLREYGEWSHGEAELMRHFVKPGDTVVDCGANVGYFTRVLADCVGRNGCVIAFEPNGQTHSVLCRNVNDLRQVEPRRIALGARHHSVMEGTMDMSNPGGFTVGEAIGDGIKVVTLDMYALNHLAFVKLDCEGGEVNALRGAEQTIARCRPILYIEDDRPEQSDALYEWLLDHDYKCWAHMPRLFNPDNFNGNTVNVFGNLASAMLLCIPREKYIKLPENLGLQRMRMSMVAV